MSDARQPESAHQLLQVLGEADKAVLSLTCLLKEARDLAGGVQSTGNGNDPVNCCFDDDTCYPMTRAECEGQGGTPNRKRHMLERALKAALTVRRLVTGTKFLVGADQSGGNGQEIVRCGFEDGRSLTVTREQCEALGGTPLTTPHH
jgi:hypothetical protein